VPEAPRRYTAALLRHLAAREQGEVCDPESGLLHAAHMACNAMFILELELERSGRSLVEVTSELVDKRSVEFSEALMELMR
jgi:hypothetical protein